MSIKTKQLISLHVINGCKNQNDKSQKQLYVHTASQLYNVAYRILLNRHDTEDVLQETYTKVFSKMKQFDPEKGKIMAWMNSICVNTALNYLKRKRFQFDEISKVSQGLEYHDMQIAKMDANYIFDFIHKLPEQSRVIFVLYEIEGYKHQEIAEKLGINVNSCRVHLSRAKTKLQEMINRNNKLIQLQ